MEQLDPALFVQVHRSVVIALRQVRRIEHRDGVMQVCMERDLRFPVSSAFRAHLKSCLPG